MTNAELNTMKSELARLTKFIEANDIGSSADYKITENTVNTEAHGVRYVFVEIRKIDLELRKQIKAIRYGKTGRGKARWNKDAGAWSILASALEGTGFHA